MYAKDILRLVETAEELKLKATLVVSNIFGKCEFKVIYNDFKIDDDYVKYNGHYRVANKDVVAVKIA